MNKSIVSVRKMGVGRVGVGIKSKGRAMTGASAVLLYFAVLLGGSSTARAATCTTPPTITIKAGGFQNCPNLWDCTQTVECDPSTSLAIGGGVQNQGNNPCLYITQSFPKTSNSWYVQVSNQCPSDAKADFQAYVVCMACGASSKEEKVETPEAAAPAEPTRKEG